MKTDGSVIIDTKIVDGGMEKGFEAIKNEMSSVGVSAEKLGDKLKQALSSGSSAPVQQAFEKVKTLQAQLASITAEFNDAIASDDDKGAEKLAAKRSAIYDKLETARKNLTKVVVQEAKKEETAEKKAAEKEKKEKDRAYKEATKGARAFAKRLRSIVSGALIFNVISKGLRQITQYFGTTLKANQEFSNSWAKLKGAALTAIQPIYELLIPVLTNALKLATNLVNVIGKAFASLAGKNYDQMKKNAKALNEQAEATENAGNAAKAAKKQMAGFDEINTLGSSESGSTNLAQADFSAESTWLTNISSIDFSAITQSLENLKKSFSDFGTDITNSLQWVWNSILVPLSTWTIEEAAPATVNALSEAFGSLHTAVETVKPALEDFYNNTLLPIFTKVGNWIITIVNKTKESFEYMKEKLIEYKDEITMVIEGISAIIQIVWSVISPIIESVISGIGSKLKTTIDFIFSLVQVLGNAFAFIKNAFLAIVNLFKGNFEEAGKYAKQALANFVNIFVGIGNAIISVINNLWSLIFDAFKGTVNAVGGLISKIGEWIGFDWNLQWDAKVPLIPKIPKYIPALAQGAVIPPNAPFMAVLGDQRNGTNIEAPLDTIKQALAEVLALEGRGSETNVNVTFTGDLAQLARVLKPAIETETRRKGGSLAKGAVL